LKCVAVGGAPDAQWCEYSRLTALIAATPKWQKLIAGSIASKLAGDRIWFIEADAFLRIGATIAHLWLAMCYCLRIAATLVERTMMSSSGSLTLCENWRRV